MKRDKIQLIFGASIMALALISISTVQIAHAQVQGNVVIASTCGLTFPGGSGLNFDDGAQPLTLNEVSVEETLQIRNTGTQTAFIRFSGVDWVDGGATSRIDVGDTKYSPDGDAASNHGAGIAYTSMTNLTGVTTTVGNITAVTTNNTYWQMQAIVTDLPFSGSLTQQITVTALC